MLLTMAILVQAAAGATPYDVTVPNAIVGLHNQYVRCQDEHFDAQRLTSPAAFRAEVERAITACAAQKVALRQQAEAALASLSEYADTSVRARAIAEAFDGYDRTRRLMAQAAPR